MMNDDNAVRLPFVYPTITGYQGLASLFAILENYENADPWRYSNYIQTYGYIRNGNFELTIFPGFEAMRNCPWIKFSLISRSVAKSLSDNIVDFFINCIDGGEYIYVMLDQSKLFENIQKYEPFPHDTFIYGYNREREVFHIADFTFAKKYDFTEVSFAKIKEAYEAITGEMDRPFFTGKGGIGLLTFFATAEYNFDAALVKRNIKSYLESENVTEYHRDYENPNPHSVYGIALYDELIKFLFMVKSGDARPDLKPLHNLYDHKKLMLCRLEYMDKNGYMDNFQELYEGYKLIAEKMLSLSNRMIKYSMTKDEKLADKMIDEISLIATLEKEIMGKLYLSIKQTNLSQSVPEWKGVGSLT